MTLIGNIVGSMPRDTGGLVGINLTTATHLTDALCRVAQELEDEARRTSGIYGAAGLVPLPAVLLLDTARWAKGEAASIRSLVDRLRRLDGGAVARWSGATSLAFADPVTAYRAAGRAVDALMAGHFGVAADLFDEHEGDPVFSTAVIGGLGPEGIVAILHPAHAQWARRGDDAEAQRSVVLSVADALAQAQRHGTTVLSIGDLVEATRATTAPLAALSLLFAGGTRFPTAFTRDAVRFVVAPISRSVVDQPGLGVDPWLIPAAGAPLDARVLILRAAALDRRAALEALAGIDLDELLPASAAYLDGGVALLRVLLAGTTPLDHRGVPWEDPLITGSPATIAAAGYNARRVIEWIGEHTDVALGVQVELGRLARPWIGSFRSAGLDDVVDRHIDLDDALARSFLVYAQAREGVAEHLRDSAWEWAEHEIHHLSGSPFRGAGFDAVGSVLGIVTVSGLDAAASAAGERDQRIGRQNAVWQRATGLVLQRLPLPVSRVVRPLVNRALTVVLPDADREIEHWRDLRDLAAVHEYLALDYLAASVLWSRRDDNGYFARPDGRPARGRQPPAELLVDPDRPELGLRTPLELDEAGVTAWVEWRSRLARGRPGPLQAAGDQFLLDTRQ